MQLYVPLSADFQTLKICERLSFVTVTVSPHVVRSSFRLSATSSTTFCGGHLGRSLSASRGLHAATSLLPTVSPGRTTRTASKTEILDLHIGPHCASPSSSMVTLRPPAAPPLSQCTLAFLSHLSFALSSSVCDRQSSAPSRRLSVVLFCVRHGRRFIHSSQL